MDIGAKIKSARETKGLTQEDLGRKCGTTKQTIFKYENGIITNIPMNRIKKIALALEISPTYLMGWEDSDGRASLPVIAEDIAKKISATSDEVLHVIDELPWSVDDMQRPKVLQEIKTEVELRQSRFNEEVFSKPSAGAMNIAKNYDALDRWGKQAVRDLVETELARMEDESRFLAETTPAPEPKIIPLYRTPAAAGYASPVFGEDYEDYTLTSDDPQGADFAVRLQGDSMEPYFPDGEVVFCNKNPLADGDIGVFATDSGAVCKQYHKEGGVVYLFSLNRKRSDADVVFLPSGGRTLVCQGRVITKRRFPVPGR